jgi:hypothetical protein
MVSIKVNKMKKERFLLEKGSVVDQIRGSSLPGSVVAAASVDGCAFAAGVSSFS